MLTEINLKIANKWPGILSKQSFSVHESHPGSKVTIIFEAFQTAVSDLLTIKGIYP